MKTSIWLPATSALVLILTGCTDPNAPVDPLGTGPYDAQGNYHEEWADDPAKWSKPGKRQTNSSEDPPMVAQNDQPPLNANPLSTGSQKLPPAVDNSSPRPTSRQPGQEVEIASRSRSSSSRSSSSATKSKSRSTAKTTSSKSKSKSKSSRYTVKKGDSLSTIASRSGSSVSAIQKANGIKGTLIKPGQSLVVPKR